MAITIPFNLDPAAVSGSLPSDLDDVEFVQLVWAVTQKIYTANDEVDITLYQPNRVGDGDDGQAQTLPTWRRSDRRCLVEGGMTPLQIIQQIRDFSARRPSSVGAVADNLGGVSGGGSISTSVKKPEELLTRMPLIMSRLNGTPSELRLLLQRSVAKQSASSTHPQPPGFLTVVIGGQSSGSNPVFSAELLTTQFENRELLEGVAETVHHLSGVLMRNLETPLKELGKLSLANRDVILGTATAPAEISRDTTLTDVVAQQSLERGDSPAVDAWDGRFTYSDLYRSSYAFAERLIADGLRLENSVLICMDKSKWGIVAMLGVLLAGGTCIPVDIRQPRKRLETLVEVSGAGFAVTDAANVYKFDALPLRIFYASPEFSSQRNDSVGLSSSESGEPVAPSRLGLHGPSNVAFVYFTSGSTGTPKGVVQEHGPLLVTLRELSRAFGLHPGARMYQYSSHGFDASLADIFGAFIAGACLCVPSEHDKLNDLSSSIASFQATHAALTRTVMAQVDPDDVPTLQYLFAVGEALDEVQFERWSSRLNLASSYGTTESLVFDTITDAAALRKDYRNIGHGLGTCLWIVDSDNPENLQPPGAVGEILIEGPVLAREYLGDDQTTRQKFIDTPAWLKQFRGGAAGRCASKCYRSGDLGFLNISDGSVNYLGRADTQVKIRGQRVELGEVAQSVRLAEPTIGEVVVEAVSFESRGGTELLVAFLPDASATPICFDGGRGDDDIGLLCKLSPEKRELFEKLRSRLEATQARYLVPSLFVPVSRLPRGITGKLDHKSLKQSVQGGLSEEAILLEYSIQGFSEDGGRQPETEHELVLQKAWAAVLGVDANRIGADQHFFQIGGDSFKAIELVSAARRSGYALTVAQIFESPRLSEQAELLEGDGESSHTPTTLSPFQLLTPAEHAEEDNDGWLNGVKQAAARACHVEATSIEDIYPSSPMQEALMAISAHRPDAYIHQTAFSIPDTVDLERFKQSWQALSSAHTIFRTRIVMLPSMGTVQVVLRDDFEWLSVTQTSLKDYLERDLSRPIKHGDNLCRYAIVDEGQGRRFFVWSGHHAVLDGWSKPMMLKHVTQLYQGNSDINASSQMVQYGAFIEHLVSLDANDAEDFWADQLSTTTPEFYPCLPSPDYVPRADRIRSWHTKIQRRPGSEVTLATLIQAAWALTTSTYAGTDENGGGDGDAVYGLTLSGRDTPVAGIDEMMGITIATVPLKVLTDNTSTVADFLAYVQAMVAEVRKHQHFGLQSIRRLGQEASEATKFQNLLVIHPAEGDGGDKPLAEIGLELAHSEELDTLDLGLTAQCSIGADGTTLRIAARFDENVISGDQLDCFLHTFGNILSQLAEESETKTLHELERVSPHDLALFDAWYGSNNTTAAVEDTIHGLFEARVKENPRGLAISGFDGQLTYAELDDRANRLAGSLQAAGVTLESKVILCFAKSSWAIAAMLAVLKCGGVCVSVNREHPTARIVELASEAESTVIIGDEPSIGRFRGQIQNVIVFDQTTARQNSTSLPKVSPTNASFVVFTSGSTGKPKGSVLEHRSLCTSLTSINARCGMKPQERVLQFAAYTFDVHIWEIFGTLLHGACVVVVSDVERLDTLEQVMQQRKVSMAMLTPTVSKLLEPTRVSKTLQTLILTGERAAPGDYQRWSQTVRVFNGLGPSECTPLTCLTLEPVDAEDDAANIGHALGCRIWVIDRRVPDRLLPIGCVGELTVEGPVVGRGYINRPKETAAAFVTDLAWSRRGGKRQSRRRFYRSGDLAKLNADGSITFIGRADTQVKIRGQRVELGEIEEQMRLLDPPLGRNVVVEVLTVSSRGNAQAVAAFVSPGGKHDALDDQDNVIVLMTSEREEAFKDAQAKLKLVLPRYMVPTIFFPLSHLPLNPSGKLDRKRLRQEAATINGTESMSQYYLAAARTATTAPISKMEKKLSALWADVLGIPETGIGLEDNFFQLGGDSVLAISLIAQAREKGLEISVFDVFRQPRLGDMSRTVVKSSETGLKDGSRHDHGNFEPFSLVDASKLGSCIEAAVFECNLSSQDQIQDMYPCTPMQEALMAVSSYRPKAYTFQTVFRLPQTLSIDKFRDAWESFVSANAIFRTRIIFNRSVGSLQVVMRESMQWRTIRNGMSLQQYLDTDANMTVDYGQRLCKFAVIEEEGGQIRSFVASMHHAIYDGWSLSLISDGITRLCQGQELQQVVPYSRFIKHIGSIDREESDEFWRRQFPAAVEGFPHLPSADYTPTPNHSQRISILLDTKNRRSRRTGITMANMIQGAWAILMAKYSGDSNDRALFGLMLYGRDTPVHGIGAVTGPTIATVPVCTTVNPEETVLDYLQGIQNRTVEFSRYQHTGLQHIRKLSPEASAAVRFQNLIVVHNQSGSDIFSPVAKLGIDMLTPEVGEFHDLAMTTEFLMTAEGGVEVVTHCDDNIVNPFQLKFMLEQFKHVLTTIVDCDMPKTLLRDIDGVSPFDHETLSTWNRDFTDAAQAYNKVDDDTLDTIHGVFEAQAALIPDDTAITGYDGQLTYAELNNKAESLCSHLLNIGIKAESRVVLCFPKSTWAIVSILAVLKSGGTCVSVSPEEPRDRVLDKCSELQPAAVLCSAASADMFMGSVPHVVIPTGSLMRSLGSISGPASIPGNDEGHGRRRTSSTDAACIIYTSGSTGKPKGCVLEHRSVTRSLLRLSKLAGMNSTTRALQFSAFTFDAHLFDIFAPLFRGGAVCVISEDQRSNSLAEAMDKYQVNFACITPPVSRLLSPEKLPSLRSVLWVGEAVTVRDVQQWAETRPDVRLLNGYGPTECSIMASMNTNVTLESMSIGKATGACSFWITRPNQPDFLVPVGCVGELLIEGPAVGRGYLSRPETTAAVFITDPQWARSTSAQRPRRFYRTGDLARFNTDGSVEYIGRADTQVKVYGQRIELGEIEFQVSQHLPDKSDVFVDLIKSDKSGQAKLTVFVKLKTSDDEDSNSDTGDNFYGEVDVSSLETLVRRMAPLLAQKLPQYMIPTAFIPLSRVPFSASAKVDRRRLRAFGAALPRQKLVTIESKSEEKKQPTTTVETGLQLVWSNILGYSRPEEVGIDDTFVSLGGDSITAMQIVSECRKIGIQVTVATMLQQKTISAISPFCQEVGTSKQSMASVRSPPSSQTDDDASSQAETSITSMQESLDLDVKYKELTNLVHAKLPVFGIDPARHVQQVYPCTAMQEGILLSQQAVEDHYLMSFAWEFKDPSLLTKDLPQRLGSAWETVVGCHAALRSGIVECPTMEHGHFAQVVLDNSFTKLHIADPDLELENATEIENLSLPEVDSFWAHFSHLTLYKIKGGGAACRFILSHVFVDGVSVDLLNNQLCALLKNNPSRESELSPFSYVDYVSYERAHTTSDDLGYWQRYLEGVQPCQLSTSAGTGETTMSPEFDIIQISESVTANLGAFCQRLGITQAAFLQAAWAVVLSTFTGQEEVCFGYLASNRDVPLDGIERGIGLFLSMQICRIALSADKSSVLTVLRQIQDDINAGFQHRNCSLAQIQNALGHKSGSSDDGSSKMLFDTCLTVRRQVSNSADVNVSDLVDVHRPLEKTEFAMVMSAFVTGTGAEVDCTFQKNIISQDLATSIVSSFETVMQSLMAAGEGNNSDLPILALDIIGQRDLDLLNEWNGGPLGTVQKTLHEIVEEWVSETPDAVATSGYDGELTYSQLNAKADLLAAHLSQLGVGPEIPVALCFHKSTLAIISIFAVFKAGGASMSLNFEHPASRLQEMCEDVNAPVVLCDDSLQDRFETSSGDKEDRHIVPINWELFAKLEGRNLRWENPVVSPSTAALIVHTSGSTGKPKGCTLEHDSAATALLRIGKMAGYGKTTRTLQFSAYSFDAHMLDIFMPLLCGGCVCVVSDDERMGGLVDAINGYNINTAFLTPSVVRSFTPEEVPSLQTIIVGGEPVMRHDVNRWAGIENLVMAWGPTECSFIASVNTMTDRTTEPQCIGRRTACKLWVTRADDPDVLVPNGCIGEILIEGPMVGRGYLNRPEATAKAFIATPKWARGPPGARPRRFYRTGDLVRYNFDGTINIIGRADTQIKVHGQRAEVGEIEYHFSQLLPKGSDTTVELIKSNEGVTQTLVAFVRMPHFTSKGANNSDLILRGQDEQLAIFHQTLAKVMPEMEARLPRYMVPNTLVPITFQPLLPSAKTDRKRLRAVFSALEDPHMFRQGAAAKPLSEQHKQPRTSLESKLQQVWCKVLNKTPSRVGIDDAFLVLGGDSITAMQVVAECRKQGVRISVATILQKKTIASMSPFCSEDRLVDTQKTSFATAQTASSDNVRFALSPIQKFYFSKESQVWTRNNQSFFFRLSRDDVTAEKMEQAFNLIVERHGMLRSRFVSASKGKGENWEQLTIPYAPGCYRFAQHEVLQLVEDVSALAAKSSASLDIVYGPVFSVDFISHESGNFVFMAAHHLTVDLVSWRVIWRDLEDALKYQKLTTMPSLSFHQWSEVQRASCRRHPHQVKWNILPAIKEIPQTSFSYWGVPESENTFGQVIQESFSIHSSVTAQLLGGGSNSALNSTVLDTLVGSLGLSFARVFHDRASPSIFIEHHGREPIDDADITQTVGWFTTMYPVHLPISPDTSATDAVRLAKDASRSVPQNGRPYFAHSHDCDTCHPEVAAHYPIEVVLNFAGAFQQLEAEDSLLQPEPRLDLDHLDQGPEAHRLAMINVEVGVTNNELQVSFHLHREMKHLSRVRDLVQIYQSVLNEAAQQLSQLPSTFTNSDFPLLDVSHDHIQHLTRTQLPALSVDAFKDVQDIYPCTSIQGNILLSQLQTESEGMYQIVQGWEFLKNSQLLQDPQLGSRLRKAWSSVLDRHQCLRSGVVHDELEPGSFLQVVLKPGIIAQFEEASHTLENATDMETQPLAPSSNSFWSHLPRLTLYRLRDGGAACRLSLSHVFMDGMSLDLLIREIVDHLCDDDTASFPIPMDFSKYVMYERERNVAEECSAFWEKYLARATPTHVPTLPAGTVENTAGTHGTLQLPENAAKALAAVSQKAGITKAVILQAAWSLVLGAYTNSHDVCFGYLASTRDAPIQGIDSSIGIFISMQVCRVAIKGAIQDMLQRVGNDVLESFRHRGFSLADIHKALGLGMTPLFNTCLTVRRDLIKGANDSAASNRDEIQVLEFKDKSEFAIIISAAIDDEDAQVGITYRKDQIPDNLAADLGASLEASIRLLLDAQSSQPAEELLRIIRQPNAAIAVEPRKSEGLTMCPRLQSAATEVASRFTAAKVGHQSHIIICLGDVNMFMTSVLAAFLSGAICTTIDPRQSGIAPADQILSICDSLKASHLLCDPSVLVEKVLARFPSVTQLDFGTLASAEENGSPESGDEPENELEVSLQKVWAEALRRELSSVGVHDNFTFLGGDSIAAIKIVASCRKLGIILRVPDILKYGTIRSIAPHCKSRPGNVNAVPKAAATAISPVDRFIGEFPSLAKNEQSMHDVVHKALSSRFGHISDTMMDLVEDIVPLAPFQSFCVNANIQQPIAGWNCLFFDLPTSVGQATLQDLCAGLTQRLGVLRTIFIYTPETQLQVVMKKISPLVESFETDEDVDSFSHRHCWQDLTTPKSLHEPFVRFSVVRTPSALRLILRLSHAQYDGLSGSQIAREVARLVGKQGGSVSKGLETPRFTDYVRHVHSTRDAGLGFWRRLLQNSPQPSDDLQLALQHSPAACNGVSTKRVSRIIPSIAKPSQDVTAASVFNAACAKLLSEVTGSAELVFGRLVSGRAGLEGDLQTVVGPCVNVVPVRVTVQPEEELGTIAKAIQAQYLDSIAHETVGLNDIIQNCTNWTTSMTDFPVVTQFINIEDDAEAHQHEGEGREQSAAISMRVWQEITAEPSPKTFGFSAYPGKDGVRIVIGSGTEYDHGKLEEILNRLCDSLV